MVKLLALALSFQIIFDFIKFITFLLLDGFPVSNVCSTSPTAGYALYKLQDKSNNPMEKVFQISAKYSQAVTLPNSKLDNVA